MIIYAFLKHTLVAKVSIWTTSKYENKKIQFGEKLSNKNTNKARQKDLDDR